MAPAAAIEQILRFNQGRDPRRLELKYRAMRGSAFSFLRGTCHLFYSGLPSDVLLHKAPAAWISGDLHLENFGAYKGDNRLVYFDLNDFDEACLAPCTWELLRFLASVFLAGGMLGYSERDAAALGKAFLDAYCTELSAGKARWIERPLAQGLIRDLLQELKRTQRRKFLDRRTVRKGKHRMFKLDGRRALPVSDHDRRQIMAQLKHFARSQEDPGFYRVLDVVDRIAGTGSLGVRRHAVLVEGRGSPDGNFLLDFKEALPSAPASHSPLPQPPWEHEAERVATLQRTIEAIAPALLTPMEMGGRPYVLKELQPVDQRVNLDGWKGKRARLETLIRDMGALTAWGQLRAAGWRGSVDREILSDFRRESHWTRGLLELARERSRVMTGYWKEYCEAYDGGAFKPK